jgi:maltodextrin utilization protein YvdJ
MTNQDYFEKLTTATTDLIIDTNQKLYTALKNQNYELAAKLRDTNTTIVSEATKAFSKINTALSMEQIAEHFNNQIKFVYDELCKEYGEVI